MIRRFIERWSAPAAPAERKASRTAAAIALYVAGHPRWTPRDYGALAREGFQKNAVVHRCVRLVAEAAASLPLTLHAAGQELREHPLLSMLSRPNPREGGTRFFESLYGHLLVSGNAYVEAGGAGCRRAAARALCLAPGPDARRAGSGRMGAGL